jgi:hypothetical protein
VEAGTGFWEAVTTVPDTVRQGNNIAASLSAAPDVDEYGFPKLDMTRFQGRLNDATLGECVSALNAGSFRLSGNDLCLQKQVDGTSGMLKSLGYSHSTTLIYVQSSNTKRPESIIVMSLVRESWLVRPLASWLRSHVL